MEQFKVISDSLNNIIETVKLTEDDVFLKDIYELKPLQELLNLITSKPAITDKVIISKTLALMLLLPVEKKDKVCCLANIFTVNVYLGFPDINMYEPLTYEDYEYLETLEYQNFYITV